MRLTETLSSTADAVNATSILTYLVCNIVTAETILLNTLIYNFSTGYHYCLISSSFFLNCSFS